MLLHFFRKYSAKETRQGWSTFVQQDQHIFLFSEPLIGASRRWDSGGWGVGMKAWRVLWEFPRLLSLVFEGCQLSLLIFLLTRATSLCSSISSWLYLAPLTSPLPSHALFPEGSQRHAVLGLLFLVWEVRSQGKGPLCSQAFLPKENRNATVETLDSQTLEKQSLARAWVR